MATAFTFDPVAHAYVLDNGLRAPSSTQVMKRAGLVSFDQVDAEKLERASTRGTAVHACTQFYDENDLDESTVAPEWMPYLEAWKKFRAECDVQILDIEKRSIGSINGMPYGLTFDRRAIVNGREAILEIKTSAQKSDWWGIQTASYDMGIEPCKDQHRRDRYGVQLKPDATYRLWPFTDEGDYDCFTWALALTWWMLNRKYTLD